jgi:3-oxoacyl-[acyl-carrier-protein] synthase II
VIEKSTQILLEKGPDRLSPNAMGSSQPHSVVSAIVASMQIQSRTTTYSSACPCGLEAIGNAMREIQAGKTTLAICGGVDAPVTPLSMACFHRTGMILSNSDHPETSGCPFDARRGGGVMSEGAGIFVLETLASARSRGAEPLAEIVGMGRFSDPFGEPPATGLVRSMQDALDDAGLIPDDIDYINAHGPGHPEIDISETKCIKKVFGTRAYQIPVSSIKGVIGNPLAAAGGIQLAASVMALREGLIPPTAHYEVPDPDCDLNYVPNYPMRSPLRNALINLHGIGGGNISLIIKKIQ